MLKAWNRQKHLRVCSVGVVFATSRRNSAGVVFDHVTWAFHVIVWSWLSDVVELQIVVNAFNFQFTNRRTSSSGIRRHSVYIYVYYAYLLFLTNCAVPLPYIRLHRLFPFHKIYFFNIYLLFLYFVDSLWRLRSWKKEVSQLSHFWNCKRRWSCKYLSLLQGMSLWRVDTSDIKVGNIVLLKEDNISPLTW